MKYNSLKNIARTISVLAVSTLAVGCGSSSGLVLPPGGLGGAQLGACINLAAGPAFLNFTVQGASVGQAPTAMFPNIPTLIGGVIRPGGLLGLPPTGNIASVTNITQSGAVGFASSGMLATPTDPLHMIDGQMAIIPTGGIPSGGFGTTITGRGQLMITPFRLQDFLSFVRGSSFLGAPNAFPNFYQGYQPGFSPYFAGGAMTGYPMTPEVLCVTQIGFALKVNTTGAGGQPVNSLYLGNAWVSGVYKGQLHGFMMQW